MSPNLWQKNSAVAGIICNRSLMDVFLRVFTLTLALAICLLSQLSICRHQTCWNLPVFCQQPLPCYPITQQIAEKLHAYTRTFQSGESSRVKDYVDILLLAEMGRIDGHRLREALSATFLARRTPSATAPQLPAPAEWERPFQRLAVEVKLEQSSLKEADAAMQRFLNPVLRGERNGEWDPLQWDWK